MQRGAKALFILATVSTVLFALVSDPAPETFENFEAAADANGPIRIVCQVAEAQPRANGTTLTLVDAVHGQARAFMSRALGEPPAVGQVVSLTLTASDTSGFFFVEAIVRV